MLHRRTFQGGELSIARPSAVLSFSAKHPPLTILQALRLNLSYVLHEPSTSQVVGQTARTLLQHLRKAQHLLPRFVRSPEEMLLRQIVYRNPTAVWTLQQHTAPLIFTLDVGASVLLPEVLELILPARQSLPGCWWLDQPTREAEPRNLLLFGGPTRLFFPRQFAATMVFAILVFRPGWRSLLLDLTLIPDSDKMNQLGTTIERIIREFVDQWWALRPWWKVPAEYQLGELQSEE